MLSSRRILTPVLVVLVTASAFSVLPSADGANPCPNNTDYNDRDHDMLSDCLEAAQLGTNIQAWDSDGDGLADARDIFIGPNDRSPQLGDIPVEVKVATLVDLDQCDVTGYSSDASKQAGEREEQEKGQRFWDPYIGTGIVRLPTLESVERLVEFNDKGFTKGNHPVDEKTLEPNVLVANIKVPQDINVFDREGLDAFPYFGVQIGLTDEDAWDHDAVRLWGESTVLLFNQLPIVASMTGGDITRTFEGAGGSCPATITLSVHSPIRIDALTAAVLASDGGVVTRQEVLQRMGMGGAAMVQSRASYGPDDNAAMWAADHALFKASGLPMEAEEKAYWVADLPDTDDWNHPAQWLTRNELWPEHMGSNGGPYEDQPYTRQWLDFVGDYTDCYFSSWGTDEECNGNTGVKNPYCYWAGECDGTYLDNPLNQTGVNAVTAILEACLDFEAGAQAQASAVDCGGIAGEVRAVIDAGAALVAQIVEECTSGEAPSSACQQALELASSVPGLVVGAVMPVLQSCTEGGSSGVNAIDCQAVVQAVLGVPGFAIATASAVLESCGIHTDAGSSGAMNTNCEALIQAVLGAPGTAIEAANALLSQAIALVNQFVRDVGPTADALAAAAMALVNGEVEWAKHFADNAGDEATAAAAAALATALAIVNGADDDVDALVATAQEYIRDVDPDPYVAWLWGIIGGVDVPETGSWVEDVKDAVDGLTPNPQLLQYVVALIQEYIRDVGPGYDLGELPDLFGSASASPCMSMKGLLGSPGLTMPDGQSHLRATLRDGDGNVLNEGTVRSTTDGETANGVLSTFVPLEWCGYAGPATLAVSIVTETAGSLVPVQQATFPLDLPAPDPAATYSPHYLVTLADGGDPALATTFGDGGFWTAIDAL